MRITPGRNISPKRNVTANRQLDYGMSAEIDNVNAQVTGSWSVGSAPGYRGSDYLYASTDTVGGKSVRWAPNLLNPGYYSVYANLPDGTASRDYEAIYKIAHADGVDMILVDQRNRSKSAYLGTYMFADKASHYVELDNKRSVARGIINADALLFVMSKNQKQPDLKVVATPVSNVISRIDISGEINKTDLFIERISNGKSFGFVIPAGTNVYYDYYAMNAENSTIKYRVSAVSVPGFASESTISRPAPVAVNADIQVSTLGYKPEHSKSVFIKIATGATTFSVIDAITGVVVQDTRTLETVTDAIVGTILKGGFSAVKQPGYYRIKTDNGLFSCVFPIAEDIHDDFIRASIRNLKQTRWPAVKMTTREDTGLPIDIGGGWEDAIDYKHWTSYNDTIQPFALMMMIENGLNTPGAEEELRYGLSYLLKIQERNPSGSGVMKFGQLAAAYSDVVSSDSTPYVLRVENIDLEDLGGYNKRCEHVIAHYLYALVLAKASAYFKLDSAYSLHLKTQAIDAFAYMDKYDELPRVKNAEFFTTKDYFRALPVINYAYKAIAAYELFRLTGDQAYKDKSKAAMSKVIQAQKKDHKTTAAKITGLFLKDVGSAEIMRNRMHSGIPLYALSFLSREFSDATDQEWFTWHVTAKNFVDGFIKRFIPNSAYGIIPYGFGVGPRKLNAADTMSYRFFQGTETQANGYSDGNTKMLALYAAALYEYALAFGDAEAAEIANKQLEWNGGKNLYGTPLIAGIGEIKIDTSKMFTHGFAPDSYDLVGTMVNGIDGGSGSDNPQWGNSWQTGETWGVNRAWMQFAIANLSKFEKAKREKAAYFIQSVNLSSETIAAGGLGTATVKIVNISPTIQTLKIRIMTENATPTKQDYLINANPGTITELAVSFTAGVADKTMVILAMPDGKRLLAKSVLGFVQ
ncbi:hypothetical protein B2I21_08830 [Chryseobacterium mucoviscidosis]|nr:hypothetical protein B2I21_08830 [Chryseobacterium mucoviscidosis]